MSRRNRQYSSELLALAQVAGTSSEQVQLDRVELVRGDDAPGLDLPQALPTRAWGGGRLGVPSDPPGMTEHGVEVVAVVVVRPVPVLVISGEGRHGWPSVCPNVGSATSGLSGKGRDSSVFEVGVGVLGVRGDGLDHVEEDAIWGGDDEVSSEVLVPEGERGFQTDRTGQPIVDGIDIVHLEVQDHALREGAVAGGDGLVLVREDGQPLPPRPPSRSSTSQPGRSPLTASPTSPSTTSPAPPA